jgi:hypothetical protein
VTSPLGLRGGLRRLSLGLIAFGSIGLVVALIGLVALNWVGGRVGRLADSVEAEVTQITVTLDRTAAALRDAGTSADVFAVTLERTPPSVRQTAATLRNLRPNLQAIEAQLASVNIFGTQPLAGPAQVFGQMAADLDGLDARLDLIADDLDTNRGALQTNASSLNAAGVETAALADRVRGGFIQDGLDDLREVLVVMILVLVGWTSVPAFGALLVGVWLRRTLLVEDRAP